MGADAVRAVLYRFALPTTLLAGRYILVTCERIQVSILLVYLRF